MMQVVPFTRCRNFECSRCLPVEGAPQTIECWACGEQQSVPPCDTPWPAARRCEACRKTIPIGTEAVRLKCPWCGKSLPASARLASKDVAQQEMSVLRALAAELGERRLVSTCMLVRCDQWLVWTNVVCEGASNEPGFELRLECRPVPEVRFVNEGATHKLGKSLRLMTELQTGDPAFDREVFIRTEASAALVTAFLRPDHVRATIKTMLSSGFHVVFAEHLRSQVNAERLGPYVLGTSCGHIDATPEHWRWATNALAGMARELPALELPSPIRPGT